MIRVESRIRMSAAFVIVGLITEWVTLRFVNPIAFIVFFAVGGICLAAGVLGVLTAILGHSDRPTASS